MTISTKYCTYNQYFGPCLPTCISSSEQRVWEAINEKTPANAEALVGTIDRCFRVEPTIQLSWR